MSVVVESQLAGNPSGVRLPGRVRFTIVLSASPPDRDASITLSIGEDWDVCFDTASGGQHAVTSPVTIGSIPTTWSRTVSLVKCSGQRGATVRVTASVSGPGGGNARSSCMLATT